MKLYAFKVSDIFEDDEYKCPGCLWSTTTLFTLADNKEEAKTLIQNDYGLCDQCMAEVLAEGNYEIIAKN